MAVCSFCFTVSGVSGEIDFLTRRNIKKSILAIRYQGVVTELDTVLAYSGTKEIWPSSSLSIIHTEDSISENSKDISNNEFQFISSSYEVQTKNFLVTDVFGEYVSDSLVPFYWKHVLPSASIDPDSVAIVEADTGEVSDSSYTVIRTPARDVLDIEVPGSYEDCIVCSNYENSYNPETGETSVYFVRYAVSGETHYQILNQVPIYEEATAEDISDVSGNLKYWRRVYILSPGVDSYQLQFPAANQFAIKLLNSGRIIVREPTATSDEVPWFVNISNGSFASARNGTTYYYSVPEYEEQDFSPLYPYKGSVDEEAVMIRGDIIKVAKENLQIDTSLYAMRILVKDKSDNTLYALTTKLAEGGELYSEGETYVTRTIGGVIENITWDATTISSWDQHTGFIQFNREFPDTYSFHVSYYYKEDGYDLVSLNVNPIFDEEYNGQFYVVYIVPTGGNNPVLGTQTASLNWLKVDRSGIITEVSQDGSDGNLDLDVEFETDGEPMYYSKVASTTTVGVNAAGQSYLTVASTAGFPAHGIVTWNDGTRRLAGYDVLGTTTINFTTATLAVPVAAGETISLYSFKDIFSSAYSNDYQWLILAEVGIRAVSQPSDLSLIDLRRIGGVIKEANWTDAIALDPRAVWARPQSFCGVGQVTPGDSAVIVKIPFTILTDYGGDFTRDAVEAIVAERHLATGMVPVIIYHGAIPEIQVITPLVGGATITWWSEGSTYHYNVYYSATSNGPWTLLNASPIEDGIYGNTYTVTGLTPGVKYYFRVTSIDEDDIESPGSMVWGIRTRIS